MRANGYTSGDGTSPQAARAYNGRERLQRSHCGRRLGVRLPFGCHFRGDMMEADLTPEILMRHFQSLVLRKIELSGARTGARVPLPRAFPTGTQKLTYRLAHVPGEFVYWLVGSGTYTTLVVQHQGAKFSFRYHIGVNGVLVVQDEPPTKRQKNRRLKARLRTAQVNDANRPWPRRLVD